MAEEMVVKEVLTERMIAAGAQLTQALDRANWPVVASLWLFDAEINLWRLVVASPAVDESGPLKAYTRIDDALRSSGTQLVLNDITAVSPRHPIVRALASTYATGRDIEGRRVFRSAIDGQFIDDAYVYRLWPQAA